MPPVEDHEVNERVKISADKPYGCKNRPDLSGGHWVKERLYRPGEFGKYELVDRFITFNMTPLCRSFYLWDTDPRCIGCSASKDIEYRDKMKGLK